MRHSVLESMRFRSSPSGPETSLIDWFVETNPVPVGNGFEATLFREPKLESGCPDLVAVVWNRAATERWNPARADLTKQDLQLLQVLVYRGPVQLSELQAIRTRPVEKHLQRLARANMIEETKAGWQSRPLREIFAATRIIAIEAKMADWRRGLEQAANNKWFASCSFLLMPRVARSSRLWAEAASLGVGIWTKDAIEWQVPAPRALPRSYASWVLHECAWRQSAK